MSKIPERSEKLKKGLYDFIEYINQQNATTKTMNILEIGSWTGVSAEIFANNFMHVVCVDPWEATTGINTEYDMKQVEERFNERTKQYNNIRKIKARSEDYAKILKTELKASGMFINNETPPIFDVIYIDGAHDYQNVKKDIELWKPFCKRFLCGHDYWPGRFDGVIAAVHETVGVPDKVFSDTSWMVKI